MNGASFPLQGKYGLLVIMARVLVIVAVVFFLEIVADHALPRIMPKEAVAVMVLADSLFLILFSAPLVWWFVYRPMRSLALSEKARFEHLFMQMVDAIIITDEDGLVTSCNPAAERIFGVSAEAIAGMHLHRLITATENRPLLKDDDADRADSSRPRVRQDCFGLRFDKVHIPLSLSESRATFSGKPSWVLIIRDLSLIRKTELELQKSNALLQATLQATADGIVAVDWERKVQVCNEHFVELMRLPAEIVAACDSIGMVASIAELMVDPAAFRKRVEALYQDQQETSHDILYLKDGRIIERYSRPQLVDGVSMGRVWSFRDNTEKIRSEQELRKSEERFRNLADYAPVGIFETDATGNCIFVNRHWCLITGLTPDKAIGRGWAGALHPDDAKQIELEWYRTVQMGRPFNLEYRFRTPDSRDNWVFGSAAALRDTDGNISGYMGVVINITERKKAQQSLIESEQRFREVFEQSEDAILLFSPGNCTVIDLNPTTEQLYGYSRAELVGHHFSVFRSKDDYLDFIHAVCNLKETQGCQLDHLVNIRKDGTEIHVSVRAKVIRLQGADAIYCTLRDISERLRMEDEARSIQAQLIYTNKMSSLGLMVAGIAHEINNPNNYIMANAQMLYKIWKDLDPLLREQGERYGDFMLGGLPFSSLKEALPEMITAINEGSRRIRNIIGDLKNYSRQRTASMELLNLNRVIRASLQLLRHHVSNATDRFEIELDDRLPLIRGNPQQLEQVVINLVMNALQSLADRKQHLCIRCSYDADSRTVRLTVKDEGCGIPDTVKEKIMEPFFTTRLDVGGTGLGLSITRSIVHAHHGIIDVESMVGKGTAVTVSLPACEDLAAEEVDGLPGEGETPHD